MHPEFPDVWPRERMEMDIDKSRGIRKEIPILDCDTLRRSANSHVLFSEIAWDREVPRGVIREQRNLSKSKENERES